MKPGKHKLTMPEYLTAPGISKHSLDDFKRSPAYYMDVQMGRVKESTGKHFTVGNCLHELFFERKESWVAKPLTYVNTKGETKKWNANSNSCKAWLADHSKETVLTIPEINWLEDTVSMMRNDHHIKLLPMTGEFEMSLFAHDPEYGLLLKNRPDWMTADGVYIDLKSTTNARTDEFSRDLFKYRYHVQAAMCKRVTGLLGLPFTDYYYIIVEKSEPARINVRRLKDTAIDLGMFAIEDGLGSLAECKASGYWPDYSGAGNKIEDIDLPAYAYSQSEMFKDEPILMGGKEIKL